MYVPAAKRRYGYYVLPLLFGDRIVGRIEPRLDRRTGNLAIAGIWFEPDVEPMEEPHFVPALATALRCLPHVRRSDVDVLAAHPVGSRR